MSVRCWVYNASYEPLYMVEAEEGLMMTLKGKAFIFEEVPDRKFHSVDEEFPVPASVVLYRYVPPVHNKRGKKLAKWNKHNLYVRDNYTCQYCGRHVSEFGPKESLTKDHVYPESRGGASSWLNLVTACSTCNGRKDDRTPEEAGMTLLRAPYNPTIMEVKQRKRKHRGSKYGPHR
jgi:hypothetical protein